MNYSVYYVPNHEENSLNLCHRKPQIGTFFLSKDVHLILQFESHIPCPTLYLLMLPNAEKACALIFVDKAFFTHVN